MIALHESTNPKYNISIYQHILNITIIWFSPGAELLGLQLELDNFKCTNAKLYEDSIDSQFVERTVISTYGSYIAESLAEWSKQVISLVQASSFSPRYA